MNNIATQERQSRCEVIGAEIIGIDGYSKRTGAVESVSVYDHKILGRLTQVWVRWDDNNALEPFFPRQFSKYCRTSAIGVYYL